VKKIVVLLALVVLALVAVVGGNAATGKSAYDLKGEVYSAGFKIEMKNRANQPLKTVKAGTYRIKIEDKASTHDFHLFGPGVNKMTSVAGVVETTWTVRLKPGKYTYACDVHPSMRGTFRVIA
jgi:plastocyanin